MLLFKNHARLKLYMLDTHFMVFMFNLIKNNYYGPNWTFTIQLIHFFQLRS